MNRNIDPLLYGNSIYFPITVGKGFLGLFGNEEKIMLCTVEMVAKKQDKITDNTKFVVIKPMDTSYSSITVYLPNVRKKIFELNPQYFIPNS